MPKDLSGAQTGMAPSNSINSPRPDNARGHNIFPQSYMLLATDRYGEYSPFYWAKCERGDVQNLQSSHNLHTFTMKSPMVGGVTMTKSYVKIPMQAIYPINWEKMMTIPTQGDDVPSDTRALLNITKLVKSLIEIVNNGPVMIKIKAFVLLENLCSHGSLFERFNQHFNFTFGDGGLVGVSFDKISDAFYREVLDSNLSYYSVELNKRVEIGDPTRSDFETLFVTEHRLVELLRRGLVFITGDVNFNSFNLLSGYNSDGNTDRYINIEPIISYQLACAQFATNDFVDDIFSAQLYRQNMLGLFREVSDLPSFSYNGVPTLYDVFSQKYFDILINHLTDEVEGSNESALDFFINLFEYQNSLRYGDYFTGSKVRPLAVGEYSAEVVDGTVSAIDITKSIQMQRLLNRVNMVGRKLGDYLAGIFGGQLPEAPKDVPIFLAHQRFSIDGFETRNTGDAQLAPDATNTITSNLRSTDGKHAFEVQIDEPCYIIGMNSYEMQRIYSRTLDRFSFHHDRYDDFIPQMQYIGDQDIKLVELDSSTNIHTPFGYCLRYMEYKQRYSYASGGFIENLPSWAFITDNNDGNIADSNINSDYLRSSPSEFDRFYASLNGYSFASYFHFIVAHTNHTNPARMMEYTPEILK